MGHEMARLPKEHEIRNGMHEDDGVSEVLQMALEHECEKLGLDPDDFAWSIWIEKA